MTLPFLLAAAPFAPVDQDYLFEARQMQALSFAVHIPLVCFGVAFPVVLLLEWPMAAHRRPLYRMIAKRWSKVMIALFAVGVVTGTILSFELGLLWPNFMATFGEVFGLGFALEGFSFFVEAIFIAIYVYGWDRLSPRAHFLSGMPVVDRRLHRLADGHLRQRLDEQPERLHARGRRRSATSTRWTALFGNDYLWHELVHMYLAAYIVAGFLIAAVYALGWLRGRRGRYERIALVVPLTIAALAAPVQILVGDWAARTVAASSRPSSPPSRDCTRREGRARAPARLVRRRRDPVRRRAPAAALAAGLPRPERARPGARRGAARRAPAGQRRPRRLPDDGRHRRRCWPASRPSTCSSGCGGGGCRESPWFYRPSSPRGRCRSSR